MRHLPRILVVTATVSAAISACYQPPKAAHVSLHVLATGAIVFQGRPVEDAALEGEIARLRAKAGELVVELTPERGAPLADTRRAVAAIRAARARVAFVHPD